MLEQLKCINDHSLLPTVIFLKKATEIQLRKTAFSNQLYTLIRKILQTKKTLLNTVLDRNEQRKQETRQE